MQDVAYFFSNDGSVRGIDAPRVNRPWPFADDPNSLYIFDAAQGVVREPLEITAFTIVLSSPNEKNYGQFLSRIGFDALIFLPDWTLEELCAVLPFVDDRVVNQVETDAVVKARFVKIGGVPRYVFASSNAFDAAVDKLVDGMSRISSDDFHAVISKEKDWSAIPNFVFTLHPQPPDFDASSTIVRLASELAVKELPKHMIENRFRQHAISTAIRDLMATFSSPESNLQLACQCLLTRGGRIKLRAIDSGHGVPLISTELPPRKWSYLKNRGIPDFIIVEHVHDNVLYWVRDRLCEIDGFAMFPGNILCLFLSIAREKHELEIEIIDVFLKAINKVRKDLMRVQLCYLVPPRLFSTFSASAATEEKKLPSKIAFGQQDLPLDFVVGCLPDFDEETA